MTKKKKPARRGRRRKPTPEQEQAAEDFLGSALTSMTEVLSLALSSVKGVSRDAEDFQVRFTQALSRSLDPSILASLMFVEPRAEPQVPAYESAALAARWIAREVVTAAASPDPLVRREAAGGLASLAEPAVLVICALAGLLCSDDAALTEQVKDDLETHDEANSAILAVEAFRASGLAERFVEIARRFAGADLEALVRGGLARECSCCRAS